MTQQYVQHRCFNVAHHSDVTWASIRLKSPTIRLFRQRLFQSNNKEHSKAPDHWPFLRGIQWSPMDYLHKMPVIDKIFIGRNTRNTLHWICGIVNIAHAFLHNNWCVLTDGQLYRPCAWVPKSFWLLSRSACKRNPVSVRPEAAFPFSKYWRLLMEIDGNYPFHYWKKHLHGWAIIDSGIETSGNSKIPCYNGHGQVTFVSEM